DGMRQTFGMIAEACAGLELQLVISLGGGQDPALLGDLPGDPVVVGYAPQLDLIRQATLTISHGGLNTALESLAQGVPMVVLPVAYGQPGAGARRARGGAAPCRPGGRRPVDPGRAADGRPAPRFRPGGPGRPGLPQAGEPTPVEYRGGRRAEPGSGRDRGGVR